jgi:hypothetical protein
MHVAGRSKALTTIPKAARPRKNFRTVSRSYLVASMVAAIDSCSELFR